MGACKRENNTSNRFRIIYLHLEIIHFNSCGINAHKLSKTACNAYVHTMPPIYTQKSSQADNGPS